MLALLLKTKSLRFEKIATPLNTRNPFGNVSFVRSARARLARSARATAPRAAVRGGRPRSLRVRPRAADSRELGVTSQNPTSTVFHCLDSLEFTYI
eukprot:scaffold133277_cov78-Phaeocystis_antarctica.AAC.2